MPLFYLTAMYKTLLQENVTCCISENIGELLYIDLGIRLRSPFIQVREAEVYDISNCSPFSCFSAVIYNMGEPAIISEAPLEQLLNS